MKEEHFLTSISLSSPPYPTKKERDQIISDKHNRILLQDVALDHLTLPDTRSPFAAPVPSKVKGQKNLRCKVFHHAEYIHIVLKLVLKISENTSELKNFNNLLPFKIKYFLYHTAAGKMWSQRNLRSIYCMHFVAI